MRDFATTEMTLPEAEKCLQDYLGEKYKSKDWEPAFKAVMDAEGDVAQAQDAVQKLALVSQLPKLMIKIPAASVVTRQCTTDNHTNAIKKALADSVQELAR